MNFRENNKIEILETQIRRAIGSNSSIEGFYVDGMKISIADDKIRVEKDETDIFQEVGVCEFSRKVFTSSAERVYLYV